MTFSIKKYQALALAALTGSIFCISFAQNSDGPKPPLKAGYPLMESPHSNPIAINGDYVYVTNTPSATVDVIDRHSEKVVDRIHVGIDPVAIAVRPDGKEIWVSNHVSDSVSVIDSDPKSPTFHVVIATIQEFDGNKATNFDEPVGIAFASNEKAYVALSSENQIAVIDVKKRLILKRLYLRSQDPRAIIVRNDKLYVLPFESGNKTQLSGGDAREIDGDLITFDVIEHVQRNNNVLSIGYREDVVRHPKIQDRDLYIFETNNDTEIGTVDTLGTLLFGIAVDSKNHVYIAQTDARNHINGRAGTKKHSLKELNNRPYANQLTDFDINYWKTVDNRNFAAARDKNFIDLDFINLSKQEAIHSFATPYAIELSKNESWLVGVAAGSDCVFVMEKETRKILSTERVGAGPRGLVLDDAESAVAKIWIFNAFDNSVTVLDSTALPKLKLKTEIQLDDPTPLRIKTGRIAFNSASASSNSTFSCASCHPDAHTDQLIWVLDPPVVTGGNQIQPRVTMPVKGLRDTVPFHWDGTQGDPYGGINSANLRKNVSATCDKNKQETCARVLIDNTMAGTMSKVDSQTVNNEGKLGLLNSIQRDDMAIYMLSVPYPPAPKRSYENTLSSQAATGYKLFHIDGDLDPTKSFPNICGDCHRFPFFTSTKTKSPLIGMDAPTWRGANDRFLVLPQGRINILLFTSQKADAGLPEKSIWQMSWSNPTGPRVRFDPVWNMVLEGSTGFSGAFARQFTVNQFNFDDGLTTDLLSALESAATQETVVLEAEGAFIDGVAARKFEMQFDATYKGGVYVEKAAVRKYYTRSDLTKLAGEGKFIGTFTARHGAKADLFKYPQPAIWSVGPIQEQRGKQSFPIVSSTQKSMTVSGRHFMDDAHVFVDGKRVDGLVNVKEGEKVSITLANLPPPGMHLLQVQAPEGRMSNDFIFHAK